MIVLKKPVRPAPVGAPPAKSWASACVASSAGRKTRGCAATHARPPALGAPRRTSFRRPNGLKLLEVANRPECADKPPSQIVPALADQGLYLASESTFYRVLKTEEQLTHRGKRAPAKAHRPEPLQASGPHQVWSWDITYLATTVRGVFFYRYLYLDLYSRKIVGCEVYAQESAEHAAETVRKACAHEGIAPAQLTLHSDHGSPMKGATMLAPLQRLGILASFSRPLGRATITPTPKLSSRPSSTTRATRIGLSTACRKPAPGSPTSWPGTTNSTAIARSSSSRPPSVIAVRTSPSSPTVTPSTNPPGTTDPSAGPVPPGTGTLSAPLSSTLNRPLCERSAIDPKPHDWTRHLA